MSMRWEDPWRCAVCGAREFAETAANFYCQVINIRDIINFNNNKPIFYEEVDHE